MQALYFKQNFSDSLSARSMFQYDLWLMQYYHDATWWIIEAVHQSEAFSSYLILCHVESPLNFLLLNNSICPLSILEGLFVCQYKRVALFIWYFGLLIIHNICSQFFLSNLHLTWYSFIPCHPPHILKCGSAT